MGRVPAAGTLPGVNGLYAHFLHPGQYGLAFHLEPIIGARPIPAWVHIIQWAALHIIIPVQGQRVCDIPQIAVLTDESGRLDTVIP